MITHHADSAYYHDFTPMSEESPRSDAPFGKTSQGSTRDVPDNFILRLSTIRQLCPEHPTILGRRPNLSFGRFCKFDGWDQRNGALPVDTKLWFTQQWIRRKTSHKRSPGWAQILKESGCDPGLKKTWLEQYPNANSVSEPWPGLTLRNLSSAADIVLAVFDARMTNLFKRFMNVVGPHDVH